MTAHTIVLDNEAAQAAADLRHPKHQDVMAVLKARTVRARKDRSSPEVLLPTVVRVEALLDRRAPGTASLGRLGVREVALDAARADRAVALRRAGGGSAVDACVAELALSQAGPTTVLTSDLTDLPRLLAGSGVVAYRL